MNKNRLKVLIAPDKFKGSLTAREVCEAIETGLNQKTELVDVISHPMADGGDGSLSILAEHLSLAEVSCSTHDPIGRPISTCYFTSSDTAYIELASASGLVLLNEKERNPMYTSTLGTGEIILDAIAKGYRNIYLFLGGSATNDAGMGIATALGFQFLDKDNQVVFPIGMNLFKVVKIKNEELFDFRDIKISLFYDVDNFLHGKNGAAYVYGRQKGASSDEIRKLNNGLIHFSKLLRKFSHIDVSTMNGAGAAGGIAAGLVALCGAKMENGFEAISELTNLEEKIREADLVISGEGKLDIQSLKGKVIDGIAILCQKYKKPLSLLVGKNELSESAMESLYIKEALSITSIAENKEDAMKNGGRYLEKLAESISY